LDRLGSGSRVFDVGGHDGRDDGPPASPVILLFAEINRRRTEQKGTFTSTIPVGLSDGVHGF
jgi:hypothetical protein